MNAKKPRLMSKEEARKRLRETVPMAKINYIEAGFSTGALTQEMTKAEIDLLLKNKYASMEVRSRANAILDKIQQMSN